MSVLRIFGRINRNFVVSQRCLSTKLQENVNSEYTEEAEYPTIHDNSYKSKKSHKVRAWHEKIKNISTIEEKIIELNMPRYWGYKCLMLDDKTIPYNTLPFIQSTTKTEFNDNLPEFYNQNKEKSENFLNLIKSELQEALEFEFSGYKKSFEVTNSKIDEQEAERVKTSGLVKQLNRILINALGADNSHLYELDADVDPRHEAFWFVGGIDPTKRVKQMREGIDWLKDYVNDPVDRPFQYIGKPYLALRHQLPLEPIDNSITEVPDVINENVPSFTFDPRTLGYSTEHRHGTSIPGFWPGNVREYGLLSYQDRNFMLNRNNEKYGEGDMQDALHSQGILSSYAWLLGQASYQGFSTYNDLTYPLTTQTIVTDGKLWSFYVYQMNTTSINTGSEQNNKFNQCWGTKEMKLYDQIDDNGKIQGLNDEVLRNLIQFYTNQPKAREHEMKPYLGAKERKVADIEDPKRRDFLEKAFKFVSSNRPRHRLVPEVYNWEKIYKIDNKTKPLVPKRRFFELGDNPFKRQLNEHQSVYIPRVHRARGPHDKKRWQPTYYP